MRLKKFEEFNFKDENLCKQCGINPAGTGGYCPNCTTVKKKPLKSKKDPIQIPSWNIY